MKKNRFKPTIRQICLLSSHEYLSNMLDFLTTTESKNQCLHEGDANRSLIFAAAYAFSLWDRPKKNLSNTFVLDK